MKLVERLQDQSDDLLYAPGWSHEAGDPLTNAIRIHKRSFHTQLQHQDSQPLFRTCLIALVSKLFRVRSNATFNHNALRYDSQPTNFMVQDSRLRRLVPHDPTHPSWIADHVLIIDGYRYVYVTEKARAIVATEEAPQPRPPTHLPVPNQCSQGLRACWPGFLSPNDRPKPHFPTQTNTLFALIR